MNWRGNRRGPLALLAAGVLLGVSPRGTPADAPARDATDAPAPRQEDQTAQEYAVKAAALYNFVVYTEWPAKAFAAADSPLVVAVLGDASVLTEVRGALGGKLKGKHRIEVKAARVPADARGAHVVFVARAEESGLPAVVAATSAVPCLVVGDTTAGSRRGGAIGFFLEEKRLRFEVNMPVVQATGLSISSRLLKLARVIEKGT